MCIQHLVDSNDLSKADWKALFSTAQDIMKNPAAYSESCKGKVMATLFFEPSTRTMFSFQTAMLRLGGQVIGFSEPKNSSVSKGEVLKDTIRTVSGYTDIIAMRHPLEGSVFAASLYCGDVPLINAGDGGHLHPTQTLTDLTTIQMEKGKIENLWVGMYGDLENGRTVHSLIKALSHFKNIKFFFISPQDLTVPAHLLAMLERKGYEFEHIQSLDEIIDKLDILYMTRVQRERFLDTGDLMKLKTAYVLTRKKLADAKPDMLVMHPLPRVDEISHDVDDDPRAVYFKQAKYGMYIRMALIYHMLNGKKRPLEYQVVETSRKCDNPRCITNHEHYLEHKFGKVKSNPDILYCVYCEKQYINGIKY